MITPYQISKKMHIHFTAVYNWLAGKYSPSSKNLKRLYDLTQVPAQAWLEPEKYFNPYCPFRYQSIYPPSLSHLSGEALELAKQIISAFPDRPPTKEEFKKFKRKLRKTKNNGGQ